MRTARSLAENTVFRRTFHAPYFDQRPTLRGGAPAGRAGRLSAAHAQDVSLRAFLKFTKIMPLAEYRRVLPIEPYHVARIVATREEDCGTCLQIEINLAKRDKVKPAMISGRRDSTSPMNCPSNWPTSTALPKRWSSGTGDEDIYRERIRELYGEEGLVELAMAIGVCRIFPTTKRRWASPSAARRFTCTL